MALLAMALPVTPGKTEHLMKFAAELKGPRRADYIALCKRHGVHERTFLQKTPMGDFVVVTFEGENPAGAFQKIGTGSDDFTKWFVAQVSAVHGVDISKPAPGPMPELVIDSKG
jgi:hypothetical protein